MPNMVVEFSSDDLERLCFDTHCTGGLPDGVVKAYRRRMQSIQSALDERDFYANVSWRCEKLKGNRQGQHSVRLNDQFRLIVEFVEAEDGKRVRIISIEDYH